MIKKEAFGNFNGEDILIFNLSNNNGVSVNISNYGALIKNIFVPDINGKIDDVILGFDTFGEYQKDGSLFGATVGPNANRLSGASYITDGIKYELVKNNGENNLHSHLELGFHKRVWNYKEIKDGVEFSIRMKDKELGFGGNREFKVLYTINDENELRIDYTGISDKNTLINMTNHSYFNLDSHKSESIKEHTLQIFSGFYTPVTQKRVTTGEIKSVINTPMDFRQPTKIGARMDDGYEELEMLGGYDHNWILGEYSDEIRKAVIVKNTDNTRTLEVYTNLCGIQIYTPFFKSDKKGKDGAIYYGYDSFTLETQFCPDSVNKENFQSAIFGPERQYRATTIYKFIF